MGPIYNHDLLTRTDARRQPEPRIERYFFRTYHMSLSFIIESKYSFHVHLRDVTCGPQSFQLTVVGRYIMAL